MNMMDQKKHANHFETSSLLPLKLALIEAAKESPPLPPTAQRDVNEELASKLIASMRNNHIIARGVVFPMKQSPLNNEIPSLALNDIKLEP
jgi:hypothetical protein